MVSNSQGRPIGKAIIWGILSIAVYAALFLKVDLIMERFSQGGIYAGAVLVTALLFSVVHGAFSNYMIESCGLKPLNKGGH